MTRDEVSSPSRQLAWWLGNRLLDSAEKSGSGRARSSGDAPLGHA